MTPTAKSDAERLLHAVQCACGCPATQQSVVRVAEVWQEKQFWEGDISVFDLHGGKAKIAYAWFDDSGDGEEVIVVQQRPGVDTPALALKAALVEKFRKLEADQAD